MDPRVEATLNAAADALGAVDLVADLSFSDRAVVVRLRASTGTVIAKRHSTDQARLAELTALRTLPARSRPKLLAHNDQVIVISDLGDGPSLADFLLGHDPQAAESALLSWARSVGSVAAESAGRAPTGAVHIAEPNVDELRASTDRFGARVSDRLVRELATAHDLLSGDVAHHAYIVGDACPDNSRIGNNTTLFDFEFSEWNHAGLEASYLLVPFWSCWCVGRFPPGLQERAYHAYAQEYAGAESEGYLDSVIRAGSLSLMALLTRWFEGLPANRVTGPADRAPARARQVLAQKLGWLESNEHLMPATAAFARDLASAFGKQFPSQPLPLYPAFRSKTDGR